MSDTPGEYPVDSMVSRVDVAIETFRMFRLDVPELEAEDAPSHNSVVTLGAMDILRWAEAQGHVLIKGTIEVDVTDEVHMPHPEPWDLYACRWKDHPHPIKVERFWVMARAIKDGWKKLEGTNVEHRLMIDIPDPRATSFAALVRQEIRVVDSGPPAG